MINNKISSRVIVICNGDCSDIKFYKKILLASDIIICADGGADNAKKIGVIPDYVIGDMDSVEPETIKKLGDVSTTKKTKIVVDPDQDKTDTELALALATKLSPSEIILLCATGKRADHMLANILSLVSFQKKFADIKMTILDDKSEILVLDSTLNQEIRLECVVGQIISVIPLTDITGLSYAGLRWLQNDENHEFGWFGICNKATDSTVNISLKKGTILIIKSRD